MQPHEEAAAVHVPTASDKPAVMKTAATAKKTFKQFQMRTLSTFLSYQCGGVIWYPASLARVGWIGHLVAFPCYLCSIGAVMLMADMLSRFPSARTYGELASAVLQQRWSKTVMLQIQRVMDTMLNLEMFVYLCMQLVTLASNMQLIFMDQYPISICILVAAAITLPTIYFKDLSGMAKLSMLSVAAVIVNVAVLAYMAVVGDGDPEYSVASPGPTQFLSSVDNLLAMSGIFILAFSVQSMIPSATYAMRQVGVEQGYTPRELRKYIFYIVLFSTTFTLIGNSAAASVVYLMYGKDCESLLPLNFTDQLLGKIASALVGFAYFCKMAVVLLPIAQCLETPRKDQLPVPETVPSDMESGSDTGSSDCSGETAERDTLPAVVVVPLEVQQAQHSPTENAPKRFQPRPTLGRIPLATRLTFYVSSTPSKLHAPGVLRMVLTRTGILAAATMIAIVCPEILSLLSIGGTILACFTMFIIPSFLYAADQNWIKQSDFTWLLGAVGAVVPAAASDDAPPPIVTAELVDVSRRSKLYKRGSYFFVFGVVPLMFCASVLFTVMAVLQAIG